jgi:HlyD family type I secretion membrane fusion protein
MNLHVRPSEYGAPAGEPSGPTDQQRLGSLKRRLASPIVGGLVIIGVFVVGLFVWMIMSQVQGAVMAPGVVRVEENRKTVKHLDGGLVQAIMVREGQRVQEGQPLMQFEDTQARSQVEVLRNRYDYYMAQRARFEAEHVGAATITWPPELLARQSDPRVARLMVDQQSLFLSRLQLFQSQAQVLRQQIEQMNSQVLGIQAQLQATEEQQSLIKDELAGLIELNEKGFAPLNRVRGMQRSASSLAGQRGELMAQAARVRQQIGETRIKLVSLQQQREKDAAEGLRDVQAQIADSEPRLRAAEGMLARTMVRSPAPGYVFGLTQHTVGGVAAPGERLLDVVPSNAPMVVEARIRPQDIDTVSIGMPARVRLSGYAQSKVKDMDAEVIRVSADRLVDENSGEPYFQVDLRIKPEALRKLDKSVQLTPGIPADTMIVTSNRSIFSYMVGPLRDVVADAMREE